LFDAAAMPTNAHLGARIGDPSSLAAGGRIDDSKALHEALSELRRSLN